MQNSIYIRSEDGSGLALRVGNLQTLHSLLQVMSQCASFDITNHPLFDGISLRRHREVLDTVRMAPGVQTGGREVLLGDLSLLEEENFFPQSASVFPDGVMLSGYIVTADNPEGRFISSMLSYDKFLLALSAMNADTSDAQQEGLEPK